MNTDIESVQMNTDRNDPLFSHDLKQASSFVQITHAELLNQMQLTMANRLPLSPIQAVGLKTKRIL